MEKRVTMEAFGLNKLEPKEAAQMPMSVLAYIGDSVYELYVRTHIVNNYHVHVKQLHKATVAFVSAAAQAKGVRYLLDNDKLDERECQIIRRGRNCKVTSMPKNADLSEYRYATAFECLVGYLYISNQIERLNEIIGLIIS